MQREAAMSSKCRYAVFQFVTDPIRETSAPIGIALWSEADGRFGLRFPSADERVADVHGHDTALVEVVERQVRAWTQGEPLPYATEELSPRQDRWWDHVRKLLVHRVKLMPPKAIDVTDYAEDLESLFETIVSPKAPPGKRPRVDGAIARCLGDLDATFHHRAQVPGYGGKEVGVLRAFKGAVGWVVVDGLNLAASSRDPEETIDAAVSRLLRIRAVLGDVVVIIGYLAAPGGLNGESVLMEWLSQTTAAKAFDVAKQPGLLREAASHGVSVASGQKTMN